MPVMEPFEGSKAENKDQQAELLGVIAQSGAAGKAAYDTARAESNKMRQSALGEADTRARLTGQNLGGADVAPVHEAADRYNTYFTGQEAAFQNNLNAIGASSESYLGKINAIAPFTQAENLTKAGERENKYKMAIAQAQAEIDAQKAAAAADHERQKELINLRGDWDIRGQNNAASHARVTAASQRAAAPPKISNEALLGAANKQQTAARPVAPVNFGPGKQPNETMDQYIARLNTAAQGRRDTDSFVNAPITDIAYQIGKSIGVDEGQLMELYSPGNMSKLAPKPAPKEAVAQSLAQKYDTKGVTYDLAKSVLGGQDFKRDVGWITSGADGKTQSEVEADLREFYLVQRNWPSEYHILMGEYVPALPK